MTSTIVHSIHDTHFDAKWGSSQPSVVPGVGNNKAIQGTSWDQQGSLQDSQDAGGSDRQQSPSDKQALSHNQDDGQYHPDQQSSSAKQGVSQTGDDGQYHEGSSWDGKLPSTPSSNGQYNTDVQSTGGQPNLADKLASTQFGATFNADGSHYNQNEQSNWDHAVPYGQDQNFAVDTIQPPTHTQSPPMATTNLTTSTSAPSIPASPKPNTSTSSTRAHAGIALSVIGAVGFIAFLILLPLYKKGKRLRQALSDKAGVGEHDPLQRTSRSFSEFLSQIHSSTAQLISSISGLVSPTQRISRNGTNFSGTQPSSETTNATMDSAKSPQIEIYSALEHSPPPSIASWVVESTLSSTSSKAQWKYHYGGQTECPSLDHMYDSSSQEQMSMGNLLSANPLIKNIYTVEMNYNSCKVGQLDLRIDQRLAILQTFENGWVCVPESQEIWCL